MTGKERPLIPPFLKGDASPVDTVGVTIEFT
jgi:hypothetical protein